MTALSRNAIPFKNTLPNQNSKTFGINAEQFLIDNRIFEAAEIGRIHAKAA